MEGDVFPDFSTQKSNCLERGITGEVGVLIESMGSNEELDGQRLFAFIEKIVETGQVVDAVLSQSLVQEKVMILPNITKRPLLTISGFHLKNLFVCQDLWHIRESIPVSLMQLSRQSPSLTKDIPICSRVGKLFKYDLSLSLAETESFLYELKAALSNVGFNIIGHAESVMSSLKYSESETSMQDINSACSISICNFGHAADQNLHLNCLAGIEVLKADDSLTENRSSVITEAGYSIRVGFGSDKRWKIEPKDVPLMIEHIQSTLNEIIYPLVLQRRGNLDFFSLLQNSF